MEIVPLIILSIFGLIILSIAVYHILRFFKGSVKIRINPGVLYAGSAVAGTVDVIAKHEISVNKITVSLICEERRRSGKSSHWVTIFSSEAILSQTAVLGAGSTRSFTFSIVAPENVDVKLPFENAFVNTLMTMFRPARRWCVESRVDATGVDLSGRTYITLQPKPSVSVTN